MCKDRGANWCEQTQTDNLGKEQPNEESSHFEHEVLFDKDQRLLVEALSPRLHVRMAEQSWRDSVVSQLKKRNREQTHCFEELIRARMSAVQQFVCGGGGLTRVLVLSFLDNKHLESASSLRTKNVELEVEAARARKASLLSQSLCLLVMTYGT